MFQFPRLPPHGLSFQPQVTRFSLAGFPHSDIVGSTPAHDSPTLFAVYHVLLRLLTPRHPPLAFSSLSFMRSPRLSMIQWAKPTGFRSSSFSRNYSPPPEHSQSALSSPLQGGGLPHGNSPWPKGPVGVMRQTPAWLRFHSEPLLLLDALFSLFFC